VPLKRRARPIAAGWEDLAIFGIGHSTRSGADLVEMLTAHGIRTLADVRTVPRSRTNPQFNAEVLPATLAEAGIRYAHLARLGGLRKPRADSVNDGWRNASFRGYADYMLSDEFVRGLEELRALAREGPVAIMCAEALRWRCHRSLVADALWARGVVVRHIESRTRVTPHAPTTFARFRGTRVTYPASAVASAPAARPRGTRKRARR
jgi:uncharacterized protein (DUF488 family)